ncbi:MAG: class I SAM-dependent methyltransferase [Spirochaetaceae bacterium]|jgi:ubiquinone/menaquinone biosynthesis C-methylase UbiE|nr:class I SAM-dependent methyltransferase [Spirochaetaceae bacterium]
MNKFFTNLSKPEGLGGRLMLVAMNIGHSSLSNWGLRRLAIKPEDRILDIGCGGGKNIARMLKKAYAGKVCGLDYAGASVAKSKSLNRRAIAGGRAEIRQGGVSQNPWPAGSFDTVTAFETIYFWPDFVNDLREIRRVLKPGGTVFICNEVNKPEEGEAPYQYWIKKMDLKIYTSSDFRRCLGEAGFIGIEIVTKGKSRICVSAKAP